MPVPDIIWSHSMLRYIRTVMTAINGDRKYFPYRLAALDAALTTAITFGLIKSVVAAINAAGERWPIGTYNLLNQTYEYIGSTSDWLILLGIVALLTFVLSTLANLSIDQQPLRRSMVKTTLALVAAVAWVPASIALTCFVVGRPMPLGDFVTFLAIMGPICVPAALTKVRPLDPNSPEFAQQTQPALIDNDF